MEDKELITDYLRNKLEQEMKNTRLLCTSCTMSTIRWLQRYSHCYSIFCSFLCFPFWILILPIALMLDICIYSITSITFIITFLVHLLIAPCKLTYQYSSCSDAWNPVNIYRYSVVEALMWSGTIFVCFQMTWSCYCGSGEIQGGAPICCIYFCCKTCHRACNQATHVEVNDQVCVIL